MSQMNYSKAKLDKCYLIQKHIGNVNQHVFKLVNDRMKLAETIAKQTHRKMIDTLTNQLNRMFIIRDMGDMGDMGDRNIANNRSDEKTRDVFKIEHRTAFKSEGNHGEYFAVHSTNNDCGIESAHKYYVFMYGDTISIGVSELNPFMIEYDLCTGGSTDKNMDIQIESDRHQETVHNVMKDINYLSNNAMIYCGFSIIENLIFYAFNQYLLGSGDLRGSRIMYFTFHCADISQKFMLVRLIINHLNQHIKENYLSI